MGTAKLCLEICRNWASERVQWGRPVGKHEAIAHMIADMAATTFAMESIASLATEMSDRGGYDIRLEAAACKEWNSDRTWEIVDDTMQIRGGRGYETETSLKARGEAPIAVERMMRDYRINKIFEGSSEIMHLFMAREAVDKHLQVAGAMIDPESSVADKLAELPKISAFYASWYPTRWLGWGQWPRYQEFGELATHLRFVERNTRRLSRQIFHGMIVYQGKLQNKQAFLFRLVDVANELFAMAASVARAQAMEEAGHPDAANAAELADLFCRNSRRQVVQLFHELWANDDVRKYKVALRVLDGKHAWLEEGALGLHERQLAAVKATGGRALRSPTGAGAEGAAGRHALVPKPLSLWERVGVRVPWGRMAPCAPSYPPSPTIPPPSSATSPTRSRRRARCSSPSRPPASTTPTSTSCAASTRRRRGRATCPVSSAPGVVLEGEKGSPWQPGTRVMALVGGGAHATRAAIPVGQLMPLPDNLSLLEGAAIPEAALTAWVNLVVEGGLQAGETVLVTGATGGMGSFAVQLARELGARVLAAGRNRERLEMLRDFGVDEVCLEGANLAAQVREATHGRGVDLVLDFTAGPEIDGHLAALAGRGRLVVVGTVGSRKGEVDLGLILGRRLR